MTFPAPSVPCLHLTDLRPGWIDIRLDYGDQSCDFSVAAVFSEPLRDLCYALEDAQEYMQGKEEGPSHFEFEWLGEGWIYRWDLQPTNGLVHVHTSFAGSRSIGDLPAMVWEVDTCFELGAFARSVWSLASQILSTHGISRYMSLWGRDFPFAQLLSLRKITTGALPANWEEELATLQELD